MHLHIIATRVTFSSFFLYTASFNDILLAGRTRPLVHLLVARRPVTVCRDGVYPLAKPDITGAFNARSAAHYSPAM